MTASNAGDPAMDPGDARPGATGPDILNPVTVRQAQSGPSERPRTGGDAALGDREGAAVHGPEPAEGLGDVVQLQDGCRPRHVYAP